MPYLTRFLASKFDQPLVNAAKKADAAKPNPHLVHGMPNTKVSSVSSGGSRAIADGLTTTSRSSFAEAFPKLHQLQEYHIAQLKSGKAVHISGKMDVPVNTAMYVATAFGFVYCMYLIGQHIRKT